MLKVLDLFSGIGGFSLGLERTGGFKTIAFCEVDPFCRRVLAKHWPGVPIRNDIRRNKFTTIKADVIVGGFPCQDISFAGAGAGLAGKRSGLWRELLRAIRVVRPRYAIVENVAALLNRGMGTVLGDLAEIGFDAEWHCIPASAVGARHQRDRVWIVANPHSDEGGLQQVRQQECEGQAVSRHDGPPRTLANTTSQNGPRLPSRATAEYAVALRRGDDVANAECGRLQSRNVERTWAAAIVAAANGWNCRGGELGETWRTEPDVGRVAHGVSDEMDRLRGLGNAVVPQVPQLIGQAILEIERARLACAAAPARSRGSHSRVPRESAELVA